MNSYIPPKNYLSVKQADIIPCYLFLRDVRGEHLDKLILENPSLALLMFCPPRVKSSFKDSSFNKEALNRMIELYSCLDLGLVRDAWNILQDYVNMEEEH